MLCISLIPFENPGWTADKFKTYTACQNVKGMLYTKVVLSRGEYNGRLEKPETRIGTRIQWQREREPEPEPETEMEQEQ